MSKFFGLLLFILSCLFYSCTNSMKPKIDEVPENVMEYQSEVIYYESEFVIYDKKIYKATTTTSGKEPSKYYVDAESPKNPWKISSIKEAQDALDWKDKVDSGNTEELTVPLWDANKEYNKPDVVKGLDNKYYQAGWWTKGLDPTDPNNQNGTLPDVWEVWKIITEEEAFKILGIPLPGEDDGDDKEPVVRDRNYPGSLTPEILPPTGVGSGSGSLILPTDPTELGKVQTKYSWKSGYIYYENYVIYHSGKYYRTKWWTKNEAPSSGVANPWKTPWQEVIPSVFEKLALLTPTDNTGGGGNPDDPDNPDDNNPTGDKWVDGAETWAIKNGYKQQWNYGDSSIPHINKALNDAEVFTKYGLDGSHAAELFTRTNNPVLSKAQWNELFKKPLAENGLNNYYSYDNFISAIKIIGKYVYIIENQFKDSWAKRCYVLYKGNGASDAKIRLVYQDGDDFTPTASTTVTVVDYAAFGTEGTLNDQIRTIAGFLAHCSHETSGAPATPAFYPFDASKFPKANFPEDIVKGTGTSAQIHSSVSWSLWFNQEVSYSHSYVEPNNKQYPIYLGNETRGASSYHGRGAFQLSWNYNYGLASAVFFGDSRVLLKYPEKIINGIDMATITENGFNKDNWKPSSTKIEGGTMAFLTSIMFWLTPQGIKPSQQDVMIFNTTDGKYIKNTTGSVNKTGASYAKMPEDNNRGKPGYGWTINLMNGLYEANKSWDESGANYDPKVRRRVLHYRLYVAALGGKIDATEMLDTLGYTKYP